MTALAGYLALGNIDPVTGVFTEASFAGYARQAAFFDFDVPQSPSGGAFVETGGNVLRNSLAVSFPKPIGLDWPGVNAFALFGTLAGGAPRVAWGAGALGGVHQRGTARTFRVGRLVLVESSGRLTSALGSEAKAPDVISIVAGQVLVGGAAIGSPALPGSSTPGQISTDLSDANSIGPRV